MKKNNFVIPVLVLFIIGLVTTSLLALTNEMTKEARAAQELARINENRSKLYPQAAEYVPVEISGWQQECPDVSEIFIALDSQGNKLGTLFISNCRGYGGDVPVMTAIDMDGKVSGLQILDNLETPGLGKKIEQASFLSQFTGRSLDKELLVRHDAPDDQRIDAISGATISSRAVAEAINAVAAVYPLLEEEVNK